MKLIKAPSYSDDASRRQVIDADDEVFARIARFNGGTFTPDQIKAFLENGDRIYTEFSYYQRAAAE